MAEQAELESLRAEVKAVLQALEQQTAHLKNIMQALDQTGKALAGLNERVGKLEQRELQRRK